MVLKSPPRQGTAGKKAWAGAIASPAVEFATTTLPVLAGQVPSGLRGVLYRNGPARLERGGDRVGHWFDGDGAVLAVRLTGETPTGTYRYVRSAGYEAEAEQDCLLYRGYGTLPAQGFLKRLKSQLKNPANTSVLALPDRLLALWEGGLPHALDPETLATLGSDSLDSLSGGEPYSAHPKRHPRTGDIFNFGLVAGANATLNVYRSGADGRIQTKHSLDLNGIPLIHDFVLADRYLVFCVPPVRLNALPAVLALQSFSDSLMWQPKRGTQIVVIDADSGEVVGWNQVDPWYQWHFGNGYLNQDGDIVLDVVAYPDFATNQNLKEIASGQIKTSAPSQLWRLRIAPQTAEILERQLLVDRHCEFPVVPADADPETAPIFLSINRPEDEGQGEIFGAIARLDPATGTLTVADAGTHRYPAEPIYASDATDPQQGWILTVVYDGNTHSSEVWIYDSDRLDQPPVCRLGLPQVIPPSFHGTWQPCS
ncbi:carotenoid oxygenase family protein [Pseudanabaena sp. FACHB-2040]|uniref:carotenoid oxygenase family protein n=1 Tax=Pseudanabaena sp. FACHB-2040 TaxID=2692859 RepID=UPI001685A004|nr:carotenoid oxygenase family protein [Pseudanabaena sp. FACHB-2040]MBD2258619.1 carotenoid oxygenase family protein [Pseudanabaena sp. FACHB-2040]